MRIIVIRHGHTTGDAEGRYGGAYDDTLSSEGEQLAIQLAKELAAKGITHIYSSPLHRAQQTAQALADVCRLPVTVIDDLRERDQYGPLTGLTKAEAQAQFPDYVEQVKDRLNTLPGAESYATASARTQAAYADILAQRHPCTAIIWHGGGMRVLFRDILKWGELKSIGDCCWVELDYSTTPKRVASERIDFEF